MWLEKLYKAEWNKPIINQRPKFRDANVCKTWKLIANKNKTPIQIHTIFWFVYTNQIIYTNQSNHLYNTIFKHVLFHSKITYKNQNIENNCIFLI